MPEACFVVFNYMISRGFTAITFFRTLIAMRDTYLALGATVTPLNWADTFRVLEKGKADGQENVTARMLE